MKSLHGWIVIGLVLLSAVCYKEVDSQRCSKKSDIVIVLDQSGSITDSNPRNGSWDNWVLVKNFVIDLIRNSDVSYDGVHFGLVTFGNIAVRRFGLLDHLDVESLVSAVRAITPGQGQTNLYAGLNYARTVIFAQDGRPDVPQVIIVITDGKANIETDRTVPEAQSCQNLGIRMFAVGVTGSIDEDQLKAVSSPPHTKNSQYWTTPDFTSLNSIVQSVQNATCDPPKEPFPYCEKIDICFSIDVPQTSADFVAVKSFIKSYIYRYLQIGADNVRICVFTFDNRQATMRIRLNQYYVENDLDLAIDNIPFVASGTADPTVAFQYAVNTAFTPTNGFRGSDFKPTLVLLLNNALPNRAAAIDAYNAFRAKGYKSIPIGMTFDISVNELGVLAYVSTDVISSTAYSQLNSKLQQLTAIMCNADYIPCPIKADICLLLDQSTSIISPPGGYDNWNKYILEFAKSVASAFPISPDDTRVGVAKFSDSASVSFYLNAYQTRDTLVDAIGKLSIDGGETNIAAGLRVCRQQIFSPQNGARANVPHILILLTDGRANREPGQTLLTANQTKADGVNIFTVGITNNVDVTQLQQICTFPPETHYFYVNNFNQLSTILNDLVSRSCNVVSTTTSVTRPSTSTTTTSPSTSSSTTSTTSPSTSSTSPSTTSSPSSSRSSSSTSPSPSPSSPTPTWSSTTILSPSSSRTTTVIETSTSRITTVCTSVTVPLTWSPTTGSSSPSSQSSPSSPSSTSSPSRPSSPSSTTTPPPIVTCPMVADVLLILDESTSIVYARGAYDNWYKYILGFAASIAGAFNIGPNNVQVGVVKFSEDAIPSIYLYDYKDAASLQAAILSLDIRGGETNIADACRVSRITMLNSRFGARPNVKKIGIMITDGEANRELNETFPQADLLKAAGVELFTIGITDRTDAGQLKRICSPPSNSHYFYVDDYSLLPGIRSAVISSVCGTNATTNPAWPSSSASTSTTTPSSSASSSTSRASSSSSSTSSASTSSASSSTSQSTSTSRSPTAAPSSSTTRSPPPPQPTTLSGIKTTCPIVADIVLIMDESTSIVYAEGSYTNWYTYILGFAKNFSSSFTISPANTQIGVMKFSESYTISFYLNAFNNVQGVVNAIGQLEINGGETNIAAALRIARTQMCSTANGHRQSAKCIIVLVTDGEANRQTNMTIPEADLTKKSGMEIFTVGLTKRVNPVELQSIASQPVSTHYYYVDDYKQIGSVVNSVSNSVCNSVTPERST